jgi:hypothetical protein
MNRVSILFAGFLFLILNSAPAKAQVACNSNGCIAYRMWIVNQNWSGFLNQWGSNNGHETTNLCAPSSVFMITRAISDSNEPVKRNTAVWNIANSDDIHGIPYVAQNILFTSVNEGTTLNNLINGVMSLRNDFANPARGEWIRTMGNSSVGPATVSGLMQRGGVPTLTYGHFYQTCRPNATGQTLYCTYQRKGGHTMAVRGYHTNGNQTYASIYDPAGAKKYDVSFGVFLERRQYDNMPIYHDLAGWFNRSNVFFVASGNNGYFGIAEAMTALATR